MTDLRTAAQQALEALEYAEANHGGDDCYADSITALRAALAESVRPTMTPKELADSIKRGEKWKVAEPVQEPAAKVVLTETLGLPCLQWLDLVKQFDFKGGEFLYTAPPQRKPLTEEEIDELSRTMVKGDKSVNWLCRAIERAHGIV